MRKLSVFGKFIISLIAIVLLVLVSVQIYNYFFVTVHTEYAVKGTMEDTFDVSGILCRNETVLQDTAVGYHDVALEDGEKVSKGGVVANVYAKEGDVKAKEQIRVLQAEIDEYNAAITAKSSYSGDGTVYEQGIQNALANYSDALVCGDAFTMLDALETFEKGVLIKEIVSGKNENYQEVIDNLQSEIEALNASIGGAVNNIVAPESGYFSRTVDGYEGEVTEEVLSQYTIQQFNDLSDEITDNASNNDDTLGKIVSGYEFQFFFVADATLMKDYSVGKSIYLRFPAVLDDALSGEIILLNEENGQVLVGVSFSSMYQGFLSERIMQATVITKTYSGIRIDKNSIRIVDGDNGVYVKVGSIIKFKKIDILYMGTTYALVDSSNLDNYDEVVTGGKDIYDGKILS